MPSKTKILLAFCQENRPKKTLSFGAQKFFGHRIENHEPPRSKTLSFQRFVPSGVCLPKWLNLKCSQIYTSEFLKRSHGKFQTTSSSGVHSSATTCHALMLPDFILKMLRVSLLLLGNDGTDFIKESRV